MFRSLVFVLLVCSVALMSIGNAWAVDVDNDPQVAYQWQPPANDWAVDHYDVEWWASGFAPQHGVLTSDTSFVVIDVTAWMPGIAQVDSVKVRGVNQWDEAGEWSLPAESVEIHTIPGAPGRPNWTPENE